MSNRIDDLEPVTRDLCTKFLDSVLERGIKIRVTQTLRTMDEQQHLYAQGRTLPGPIVTRAKPGQSAHNFGMAFDICFQGAKPYPIESDARWQEIGELAERMGLSWGGPNGKGDRFTFDRPHFERAGWKSLIG